MRRTLRTLHGAVYLLVFLVLMASAGGGSLTGKVVAIADGDTITVLDASNVQHRIRLQGVDAPEHRQAFGTVSRTHLGDLVFGKTVTVEYSKTDQYGRIVGKVLLAGRDICLEQVEAGMAWHYKQYQDEQTPEDRKLYAQAEDAARATQKGLWADAHPIPPWDFRHGTRSPLLYDKNGRRIASAPNGPVRGNVRSHIYQWPSCPYYDAISPQNRVEFPSRQAAEQAGYRAARNCP